MIFLLADEDKDNAKRIGAMLRRNLPEAEIAGYVESTEELYSMIESTFIGFLLITVSIANNSGVQVAKEVKKRCPWIHIILTAMEETIQVYRETYEIGALCLLIEPVNKKKLIPILQEVKRKHSDTLHTQEEIYLQKNIIKQSKEAVEHSFIYSFLFGKISKEELADYKSLLEIPERVRIMLIHIEKSQDCSDLTSKACWECLKELETDSVSLLVGPKLGSRIAVVVMEPVLSNTADMWREKLSELALRTKNKFTKSFRCSLHIGISREKRIEELADSYGESLLCLRFINKEKIVFVEDIRVETKRKYQDNQNLEKEMLIDVAKGNDNAVNKLGIILENMKEYRQEDKQNKIIELLILAVHAAKIDGDGESEFMDFISMAKEVEMIKGGELDQWTIRYMNYILKMVRGKFKNSPTAGIRKVMKYVEENYSEDVALETMSAYIKMSPQYFSKLFRKKTNYKYVEWVTLFRIKKAMEWLEFSKGNIQEVGHFCGFQDPNYFSRVFKKVLGITPKEFIKMNEDRPNIQLPDFTSLWNEESKEYQQ